MIKVDVEVTGSNRWIRVVCPECNNRIVFSHCIHKENKHSISCSECGAVLNVTWEESDESLH